MADTVFSLNMMRRKLVLKFVGLPQTLAPFITIYY